ncbi:MAG: efflux RND transporter permease subunit, partial [Microcystaceae cyanobacterium]
MARRSRLNLSALAIQYPRLTLGFWLALAVAGLLALSTLKYGLFPEVAFPVVIVNATAPTPTVIQTETQLTHPLEQALTSLPQTTLYSTTYAGRSLISVAFDAGLNLETSTQQVKQRLATVQVPQAKIEVFPFNL